MFCWICGRELDGKISAHYIPVDNKVFPVCRDDRSCGLRGNYYRLNNVEDEQLIIALLETGQPIPRRLKGSQILYKIKRKMHL